VAHAVVAIDEVVQKPIGRRADRDLEDREAAARTQHPPHFSQHGKSVIDVMQSGDADQSVNAGACSGSSLNGARCHSTRSSFHVLAKTSEGSIAINRSSRLGGRWSTK
jgi:hypothetical protein